MLSWPRYKLIWYISLLVQYIEWWITSRSQCESLTGGAAGMLMLPSNFYITLPKEYPALGAGEGVKTEE